METKVTYVCPVGNVCRNQVRFNSDRQILNIHLNFEGMKTNSIPYNPNFGSFSR